MTGYQIKGGISAARAVRENYPDLPIIWGGWHGSILPLETANDSLVDIIVRGQGEQAMLEVVRQLESSKTDLSGVQGIAYKSKGQATLTSPRAFENINRFPAMPYHLTNIDAILKYRQQQGMGRMLEYSSSQGCPNCCAFCAEPLVMKRGWSGLAATRVVKEWTNLVQDYGLSAINLVDSNFFVDINRIKEICQGLISSGLKISWYNANGTVAQLVNYDREMWQLLADSGCRSILVGAESGSEDMLALVDKQCTVADILTIAKRSKEHCIQVSFSFMTGLPPDKKGDAKREFKATMGIIHDILRIDIKHDIKLFLYTPYPGSHLYNKSIKLGLQVPRKLEEWHNFELINTTTPWVSNKFKRQVDQARDYAIPFMQRGGFEIGIKGLFKRLLAWISILRLQHGWFGFTPEYWLIRQWWKIKGVLGFNI